MAAMLMRFCPFMDADGCMFVGCWLNQTMLSNASKHPINLTKQHPLTHLLIWEIHESCGLLGYNCVLTYACCKYWIISGVLSVRHYMRHCVEFHVWHAEEKWGCIFTCMATRDVHLEGSGNLM